MAVPSTPSSWFYAGNKRYGSDQYVSFTCEDADYVTVIVSQTSGGAALWTGTVTESTTTFGGLTEWTAKFPTTSITSSPFYVRAYGTNSDGNGPTAERYYILRMPPTISITTPADNSTLTSAVVTMQWTVASDGGVSWQRVTVKHGDTVLCSEELEGSARTYAVPSSAVFETGQSYTFTVEARSSYGMEASATSTASFSYTAPKDASLAITQGAGMSADLKVTFGSGSPATTSVDVMRMNADGSAYVIAEGVLNNATVNDPLPPLGTAFQYMTVSHASGNRISKKLHDATIETAAWALNYGSDGFVGLIYNPQASYSMSQGGDLYHFADGGAGGGLPVWYGTTDRDESGTLRFDTIMNSDADALRAAVMAHPVMWLRDPFGHRWRARVTLSYTHGVGQLWPVTLTWDAVRFEEA